MSQVFCIAKLWPFNILILLYFIGLLPPLSSEAYAQVVRIFYKVLCLLLHLICSMQNCLTLIFWKSFWQDLISQFTLMCTCGFWPFQYGGRTERIFRVGWTWGRYVFSALCTRVKKYQIVSEILYQYWQKKRFNSGMCFIVGSIFRVLIARCVDAINVDIMRASFVRSHCSLHVSWFLEM